MAAVKCIITFSAEFISQIGMCVIDGVPVNFTEDEPGKITIERDEVATFNGLNVYVSLHADTGGLECLMDVFVNDTKINIKPVEASYLQGGHYVFNYNA